MKPESVKFFFRDGQEVKKPELLHQMRYLELRDARSNKVKGFIKVQAGDGNLRVYYKGRKAELVKTDSSTAIYVIDNKEIKVTDGIKVQVKGLDKDKTIYRVVYSARIKIEGELKDDAMKANIAERGGIDLTSDKALLVKNDVGEGIKFHLDPAVIAQLQNTPGFVPVIINIEPLDDLRLFLGITLAS